MTYHCDRCGAALPAGARACPACGKAFDSPVPGDVPAPDVPFADVLRGRTAAPPPAGPLPPPPPYAAPNTVPRGGAWKAWLAGGAALLTLLALGVWAISALWTLGPGGEAAFRRHNLAGNAALERGDFRTADDEYGRMIALRPHRVDGYLLRGICEAKEGLYTAAGDDDTVALGMAREPMMRGDLLHNRGEAREHQGEHALAVADFTDSNAQYALVRDPRLLPYAPDRLADNHRDLAEAHWQHREYAPSVAEGSAAIALGHPRPADFALRGKAEAALGRDAAAAADFTRAIRLDPSDLTAYVGVGLLADKHHRPADAVAVYESGTRAEPGNALLWGNLGWYQYQSGQTAQALVSDRRALGLDPGQVFVAYNLGLLYADTGRAAEARAAYADALTRGGSADRQAGLADIHTALARHPASPTLQAARAQVVRGPVPGAAPTAPAPAIVARPVPLPSPAGSASALGPEVALRGGYVIRPPAGWGMTQSPELTLSSDGTDYIWAGPTRADGTAPTLEVVIAEDGGALASHTTSRREAGEAVALMAENHTHLSVSAVTDSPLNGLPFARADWSGQGVQTGLSYRGSECWLVSPSHILHLATHDEVNSRPATGPLLRASVLTFRRQ